MAKGNCCGAEILSHATTLAVEPGLFCQYAQSCRSLALAHLPDRGDCRQLADSWMRLAILPFANRLIRDTKQRSHLHGRQAKTPSLRSKALGTEAEKFCIIGYRSNRHVAD